MTTVHHRFDSEFRCTFDALAELAAGLLAPPSTEIHLLNGAHFLLESHLDDVTALIRSFGGRTAA